MSGEYRGLQALVKVPTTNQYLAIAYKMNLV